jgi:hypothetical protein
MSEKNLQIPYGVFDFKRIRNEGYYYVDKTGYIPLLEQAGSFLFFVRPRRADRRGADVGRAEPKDRGDRLDLRLDFVRYLS